MNSIHANSDTKIHNRAERLKEAVIATFYKPAPEVAERLVEFSADDWRRSLFWLDVSGLALYFLDRLTLLGLQGCLPESILARLQKNLDDNRKRTAALFEEMVAISQAFKQCGISFALLKGFTLAPESVPDSALRHQMDIDFLITEKDATAALHCLNDFGYILHAISGKTWECKAGILGIPDMRNLYKVHTQRSVELHLLPTCSKDAGCTQQNRLTRAQCRSIQGVRLPALSAPDLFLHQALHLFKHLCGEHTRASWMLEFRQHVLARRDDLAFWSELELLVGTDTQAKIAIGAVTLLATQMFGDFVPEELSRWSIGQLPAPVCLWMEIYGRRALLTDFPGSKLYLLLRQQLQTNLNSDSASSRRLIFPFHLPPRITHAETNERLASTMKRYRVQVSFVFFRLRFHIVEGLRYAIEASRWQRRLTGAA
jgi:hypothetical protein